MDWPDTMVVGSPAGGAEARYAELERRMLERTAELERAYEELEMRRAYLESIVERIPAGLVLAEAPSGQVLLASEEARRVLGDIELPQDLGEYTRYEGYRDDRSRVEVDEWPLVRALRGEVITGERLTIVRADGRRVVVEASAAPVRDRGGEILAAICLFSDITERELRERTAREFITNAAHELRTPLTAILGAVDVLQAGAKEHPRERDRFLNHVEREAGRLARLTRALLVLARAQGEVEPPRLEVVRLKMLLAEVADGLRPAADVRVHVRCRSDAAALANRELLEQAVTSIAVNAARYTQEGRIVLSCRRRKDRTSIEVRDTGRGMNPEELRRAADRFYRGVDSLGADGPGQGFGLGLAIARQAIEAMHGSLELESAPGEGTVARIELQTAKLLSA